MSIISWFAGNTTYGIILLFGISLVVLIFIAGITYSLRRIFPLENPDGLIAIIFAAYCLCALAWMIGIGIYNFNGKSIQLLETVPVPVAYLSILISGMGYITLFVLSVFILTLISSRVIIRTPPKHGGEVPRRKSKSDNGNLTRFENFSLVLTSVLLVLLPWAIGVIYFPTNAIQLAEGLTSLDLVSIGGTVAWWVALIASIIQILQFLNNLRKKRSTNDRTEPPP